MLRLFVGIALPADLRDRLARLQHGVPGAKWVAPENLHLTLRFIGEVDEDVAEDIDRQLATVRCPAFPCEVGGMGRFGGNGGARVLWVGVTPDPGLVHLRDRVEKACVRAGLEPEGRKYKPHVTLARFKGKAPPRADEVVAANTGWRGGTFTPDHFTLYRSILGHEGPAYSVLAEYPLAAAS